MELSISMLYLSIYLLMCPIVIESCYVPGIMLDTEGIDVNRHS